MCVAGWIGNPLVPDVVEHVPADDQIVLVYELFQYDELSDELDDEIEDATSDENEPMDESSVSDANEPTTLEGRHYLYLLRPSEEIDHMRWEDAVQENFDRSMAKDN